MFANVVWKKIYWHFFKVMPCEMILKKKWDEYNKVKKIIRGKNFDVSKVNCKNPKVIKNRTVWVFWDSGLSNAPIIVQKCRDSVKRNIPVGWSLIELNKETYTEYVSLPDFIEDLLCQKKIYLANWSDILRTALLYCYGGIWIDSTCFLTSSIPPFIINEPFFMFSMSNIVPYSPMRYESWFIRAEAGNFVLGELLQKLLYYFHVHKNKKEFYFVWFYILSTIYENDRNAREMMDSMWFCNHHDALLMHVHYGFQHPYSDKLWEQIVNKCFVQKLSYKYERSLEHTEEMNLLQYILKG